MVFLPAFTCLTYKLIDRTHHRPLMPSFKNMGKFVAPLRIPVVVRSNVPGGKSGVGHEKGGSEEPPSRKHMVEVLGAYLIIISALVR